MAKREWTEHENATIRTMYAAGKRGKDIALALGRAHKATGQQVRKLFPPPPEYRAGGAPPKNPELTGEMLRLANEGLNYTAIGRRLGMSACTIRHRLLKAGWQPPKPPEPEPRDDSWRFGDWIDEDGVPRFLPPSDYPRSTTTEIPPGFRTVPLLRSQIASRGVQVGA